MRSSGGRTSRNVIAGSTETFTGQASVWWRDEFCQQITRLWAKTNELRLQAELRLMDFPSSTVKQPQSSVLNVYCRVQVMLFFCISVQTNQHHYGFARRGWISVTVELRLSNAINHQIPPPMTRVYTSVHVQYFFPHHGSLSKDIVRFTSTLKS